MAIFMDKYDSKQISIYPVVQIKCTLQARKNKTKYQQNQMASHSGKHDKY